MEPFASSTPEIEDDCLIRLQGLSVIRERAILEAVDWTVRAGERWVLMGPNGSGKTTLLNSVLGYMPTTSGDSWLVGDDNEAFETWDDQRRQIGFVSNHLAHRIDEDETAHEVVMSGRHAMLNYWMRRPPADDAERARAVLERIECGYLATSPWAHLSQGEKQRILIGRSLMADDLKVLILDEPCAGLDPVAREHFLTFLQQLAATDTVPGIVLVTHHVEEIMPAFTHVLVLREGHVVASGPIRDNLTSETLSTAFDARITVRRREDRYAVKIGPTSGEDEIF